MLKFINKISGIRAYIKTCYSIKAIVSIKVHVLISLNSKDHLTVGSKIGSSDAQLGLGPKLSVIYSKVTSEIDSTPGFYEAVDLL